MQTQGVILTLAAGIIFVLGLIFAVGYSSETVYPTTKDGVNIAVKACYWGDISKEDVAALIQRTVATKNIQELRRKSLDNSMFVGGKGSNKKTFIVLDIEPKFPIQ